MDLMRQFDRHPEIRSVLLKDGRSRTKTQDGDTVIPVIPNILAEISQMTSPWFYPFLSTVYPLRSLNEL